MKKTALIPRRWFLRTTALASTGAWVLKTNAQTHMENNPPKKQQTARPDPLAADLVKEWVTKAHGNFEYVQEALTKEPRLLNAAWDWGGGDFETALEAAGHVGHKDIARYLLTQGARLNIFCAAMLGELETIKALLTAYPHLKSSKGPHGLQLLHHAEKGGEEAKEVLAYLKSIGAS